MNMKKAGILVIMLLIGFTTMQVRAQDVLDGLYVKEHIPTKKVISYTYLREADVMWEKRVHRRIENSEKINQPLFYPLEDLSDRQSLFSIIKHHLYEEPGSLTYYYEFDTTNPNNVDGLLFKYPLKYNPSAMSIARWKDLLDQRFCTTPEPVPLLSKITGTDSMAPDPKDPNMMIIVYDIAGAKASADCMDPENVVAWELKEDWFFDKQRSVMDVRIIGIAPLVYRVDPSSGKIMGTKRLGWFYYPELRYIIQNYFVYNRKNDAQRMSFDDLFWKRMFNSIVIKESNVFDRVITDYVDGVDALLESERIKKEMMEIEHDMWDL
jgi:gliding motility associated protien GldN